MMMIDSLNHVKTESNYMAYQSTKGAADVASVMTTERTTTDIWQFRFFLQCSGIFFLHAHTEGAHDSNE